MLEHLRDDMRDFFRRVAGKETIIPEPQKGMTWHITQERAYPHSYRGYSDGLSRLQIIGVDDEKIEFIDNCWYQTISRDQWNRYYEDKLRRARSTKMEGGGSIVPTYLGIQNVNEGFAEMLRNPPLRRLCY